MAKKNENQTIKKYLETLLDEKGINRESYIELEHENKFSMMSYQDVIEFICSQSFEDQNKVKNKLMHLDFVNGNIKDFFEYLTEIIMEIKLAEEE